jgi:hypothetical protein
MSKSLYYQLADIFEITAIYSHNDRILFRAKPYKEKEESLRRMRKRLTTSGFEANVREDSHGLLIAVGEAASKRIPRIHIILFFSTLVSMFFVPSLIMFDLGDFLHPRKIIEYFSQSGVIIQNLEFTVALMMILLCHEFGHYLAGRRRGVLMSLPYFIPGPTIFGTFGAIIKSRSPFSNRRDLLETGAAGPVAGFVIAIIVLSIGLADSKIVPLDSGGGFIMSDPLIMRFLSWLIVGSVPDGHTVALSALAYAGWGGLFVTMLNLLPLGQLDGGHIIYGLAGRWQRTISKIFIAFLLILGFWWMGWWIFGALIFLFGLNHPPTLDDNFRISPATRMLGISAIVIFIICFMPVPLAV